MVQRRRAAVALADGPPPAAAVSAGTGRAAPARTTDPSTASGRHGRWVASSALAGAGVWLAWLGWDRTASYDSVTGTVQDPYVTLQVLGCAACLGVLVAALAAAGRPFEGAGGAALGFWFVWTVDAFSQDDSGLAGVGALFLMVGLAMGAALVAMVGWGLRRLVLAWRRKRFAWSSAPR